MAPRAANLTTLVSTKGQVILPRAIRDQRNWPAGTRLTVEETPDGVLLKAAPLFPATTLDEVVGILRDKGNPLSLDDMELAVAAEAKGRARR